MSPTHHHSATSTTNITLRSLPTSLIQPKKGPKAALEATNFSCLSKSAEDYSDSNKATYYDQKNNNWVASDTFSDVLSKGTKVGSIEEVDILNDAKRREDLSYLGEGGFSRWGGEKTKGGWIRRMGYGEQFMTGCMDFGFMSTLYNLWFESSEPITLELLEETCQILIR